MNTMTYKGYLGSVAYSEKDNVFIGKIEGINGLVNFEGESVKELTEAFHEAVDDYLAYCQDEGIEPEKSYTGILNVRLTPAIHRQIAMLAKQAGMTINGYIKEALEEKAEAAMALHKRVMRSGSWIQATGPNNGHQLRDYSKSS